MLPFRLFCPYRWEKLACGRFSDVSFVSASKKRGFCWLRANS